MGNLFCIAGHDQEERGALAYNGVYEHHYTHVQQGLIAGLHPVIELDGSIILDDASLKLSEVISKVNGNSRRGDYGIDLHFNNNNPRATGVEAFVHPSTTEVNRRIARQIVNEISGIINIPVRKHVARRDYKYPAESARGRLGIIERTNIPFILLETCFLNELDLPKYIAKKRDIASMILEAYKKHKKL